MKKSARKVRTVTYSKLVDLWSRIAVLLVVIALLRNWFHAGSSLLSGRSSAVFEYLFDWWMPLMLFAAGSLIFVASDRGRSAFDYLRFRRVFGFAPPRDDSDFLEELRGRRVNETLKSLAIAFMQADYEQRRLEVIARLPISNWEDVERDYGKSRIAVEKAKRRFWTAVELAQEYNLVGAVGRYEDLVPCDQQDQIREGFQNYEKQALLALGGIRGIGGTTSG